MSWAHRGWCSPPLLSRDHRRAVTDLLLCLIHHPPRDVCTRDRCGHWKTLARLHATCERAVGEARRPRAAPVQARLRPNACLSHRGHQHGRRARHHVRRRGQRTPRIGRRGSLDAKGRQHDIVSWQMFIEATRSLHIVDHNPGAQIDAGRVPSNRSDLMPLIDSQPDHVSSYTTGCAEYE